MNSMSSHPGMVVVFDIGGVLCREGLDVPEACRILAADPDTVGAQLAAAYWEARDAYDLGQSDTDYWSLVAQKANLPAPSDAQIGALTSLDSGRWAQIGSPMAALINGLAGRGVPLGLLSNAPTAMATVVKNAPWSAPFGHKLFSSDLGAMKPFPAVYKELIAAWARPAGQLVFFDDRLVNVVAAQEAGIDAHLVDAADTVERVLGDYAW